MSFKNILLAIAPVATKQSGCRYTISMGRALDAKVTGCSYALSPEGTGLPWFPHELLETHMSKVMKEADTAVAEFREAARASNVEISTEVFRATLDTAVTAFGEQARTYDITVLTQSGKGLDHVGDLFAEAALFYSGRPLILVPSDYADEFSTARVLIAWDGGQHAASAVAHAMPIISRADKVEVLVVGDKEKVESTRAAKLIATLERHGIDVDFVCRDEHDDANAIVREAAAWNASLLVMGGYGHSRAREIFFGGVTRYMVGQAPIPVLMAH